METLAHIQMLSVEGKVEKTLNDGFAFFRMR
jgi:hypothetical protein